jgi:hypothetical protein
MFSLCSIKSRWPPVMPHSEFPVSSAELPTVAVRVDGWKCPEVA